MGQARANTILQRLNYVAISAKAAGCAATEEPSERSLPFDVCTPFHSPKRAVYVLNERHQKREEKGLGDESAGRKALILFQILFCCFSTSKEDRGSRSLARR